jgi:tetratricopeptide (TPR) repeat protein
MQEAVTVASQLSVDDLRTLTRRDREVMLEILLYTQLNTTDSTTAIEVSRLILDSCDKLARGNLLGEQMLAKFSSQTQTALDQGLGPAALNERQRSLREQIADRAGALVDKAIKAKRGPMPAVAYWVKARGLMSQGSHGEALAAIEQGIADWEKLPAAQRPADNAEQLQLHLIAARLSMLSGRPAAQIEAHLKPLEDRDQYAGWLHLIRGQLLLREGKYASARDELKRAEKTLGQQIELSASLAHASAELKEWEPAIVYLERMLEPDENLSDDDRAWRRSFVDQRERVHFELLRARLKLGRWQESQENLRELRETEFAPQAWYLVVDHLWQNNEREKAREYLRRARDVFPDDIDLMFLAARALQEDGQGDSAELLFQDFVDAAPNDPVRRLAHARWLIYDGKTEKALRALGTLERSPSLSPKAENTVLLFRAQVLVDAGEYDKAAADLERLINKPETRAAGYLLKAVVGWKKEADPAIGDALLTRARAAEPRRTDDSSKLLTVYNPQREVVGVVVEDVYYW